jgi:hypothetical protein
MSYACSYECGEQFTNKSNMDRHMRKFHVGEEPPKTISKVNTLPSRIKIKLSKKIVPEFKLGDLTKKTQPSEISELTTQLAQVVAELGALKKTIADKPVTNNITINNTLIYNCFDQNTIDIFNRMLELYGSERAISYSGSLLKNKNKNNKHEWMRNSELVDLMSLNHVITYESNPRNQGFHIVCADQKTIIDTDGSMVDKILTDTVVNANLKAQSHLASKASQAMDEGNSDKMWEIWTDPSIYSQRGETIHDYIMKFKKVTASKPHLIEIINGKI